MSKSNKPVWVLFDAKGRYWGPYPTRQQARDIAYEPGDRIVKYIPAPVAPKAPKPAPKPVAVLTDWISCETPPVRVGVYERDHQDGDKRTWFQKWDGEHWCMTSTFAGGAEEYSGRSSYQGGKWRGYTTPQE
jgi:hypothetical protein